MQIILLLAIFISIGFVFALPMSVSFVQNLNKTRNRLVLFSLSLIAFSVSYSLLAYGLEIARLLTNEDACFAREEPCSVYFPDAPEKDTMLSTELWLRNLLPPFVRPNVCFSGDMNVCNAAIAEHLRLGSFYEILAYFLQITLATISLVAYMGFAWRFTREKPKAKRGGENTP